MAGRVVKFPEKQEPPEPGSFYDITATVDDTDIWRELYVPVEFTLEQFAELLIKAFDWGGGHIWFIEDVKSKTMYDDPAASESDFPTPEGETHLTAASATVGELLAPGHAHVRFVYDLGDWWEITLEHRAVLPGHAYPFPIVPVCVDGAMMAPLEDVGGVAGWFDFCRIVNDPDEEEYESFREWAGIDEDDEFVEEYFSPRDVNFNIALGLSMSTKDDLPDDVEELKQIVVALTADNVSLEIDSMLVMGNMISALSNLQEEFDLPDLFGGDEEPRW